ncbi:hypothetical protein ABWH96_16780 [Marivirga tractuosa]|uniref:hypothetical protein n=1 Tax=Marivirga tractuosa TaxID=1006 RepID=UPI0035CEDF5D
MKNIRNGLLISLGGGFAGSNRFKTYDKVSDIGRFRSSVDAFFNQGDTKGQPKAVFF